jgi:hypothetical protein
VIEALAQGVAENWPGESYGQEQGQMARIGLLKVLVECREISASKRVSQIMNLRDKYLAHSSETGDSKRLVRASILVTCVSSTGECVTALPIALTPTSDSPTANLIKRMVLSFSITGSQPFE